jgi:hypothetical protein
MSGSAVGTGVRRVRREPPPFRDVTVVGTGHPTPHVVRVVFDGTDLHNLVIDDPAASIRLLLPGTGTSDPVIPTWNGNESLFANGQRPTIRTLTPIRTSGATGELRLDIVVHGSGPRRTGRPPRPSAIVPQSPVQAEDMSPIPTRRRLCCLARRQRFQRSAEVARSDPGPPRAANDPRRLACPARRSTTGSGAVQVCAPRDRGGRCPHLGRR